jgi:hypothetical protein
MDELLVRYVEALIYQAVAENMVRAIGAHGRDEGRHRQRGSVIGELKLVYNKTRQAAITKNCRKSSPVRLRSAEAGVRSKQNLSIEGTKMADGKSFSVSAPWWTWSFRATRCPRFDALKLEGSELTLEVQQQLGDGVVRTIALGSSDGLRRGMPSRTPASRSRCPSAKRPWVASWTCWATRSTNAVRLARAKPSIHRRPAYDELSPSQNCWKPASR